MDDKLSLKGAWSRHVVTSFKIFSPPKISLEQPKLEISIFMRDSVAIARICHGNSVCLSVCLSVHLSVCHTGGSVKNG